MKEKSPRINKVAFVDLSLKKAFEELMLGKFEDKELAESIQLAIDNLKENPLRGIRIPSKQWPKEYIQKYSINNLRKYDLRNSWRLIYTIKGNELEIVSVILEWFSHKEYERRFDY